MKETLAFHISALYREFLAYTTEELKSLGLSFGQIPLIIYTGKHPGCTQADLTRALRLDWGYSQRSIAKLVSTGFLKKELDEKCSCNCLTLTESGIHAFESCHKVFYDWDRRKTVGLTEEETTTLLTLLSKLSASREES